MVLTIPAPIIAATPKPVRSATRKVRFIPPVLPSKRLASCKIVETDFFRNKFSNFTRQMYLGKNKEKTRPETFYRIAFQANTFNNHY
jgi:hypothetical protein